MTSATLATTAAAWVTAAPAELKGLARRPFGRHVLRCERSDLDTGEREQLAPARPAELEVRTALRDWARPPAAGRARRPRACG